MHGLCIFAHKTPRLSRTAIGLESFHFFFRKLEATLSPGGGPSGERLSRGRVTKVKGSGLSEADQQCRSLGEGGAGLSLTAAPGHRPPGTDTRKPAPSPLGPCLLPLWSFPDECLQRVAGPALRSAKPLTAICAGDRGGPPSGLATGWTRGCGGPSGPRRTQCGTRTEENRMLPLALTHHRVPLGESPSRGQDNREWSLGFMD